MKLLDNINAKQLAKVVSQLPDWVFESRISFSGKTIKLNRDGLINAVDTILQHEKDGLSSPISLEGVFTADQEIISWDFPLVPVGRPEGANFPVEGILPGIFVVLGNRGAGKTEYMFGDYDATAVIRMGEPAERFDNDERVIHVFSILDGIAAAFIYALAGHRVGIDSLRALVFGLKGAAGEKGIKAEIFNFLTLLNNLISVTNSVVAVVVNPLISEDAMETFFQNTASSASGAVMIAGGKIAKGEYRTTNGRLFVGMQIEDDEVQEDKETSAVRRMLRPLPAIKPDANFSEIGPRKNLEHAQPELADDEALEPRRGARIQFTTEGYDND